MAEQTAPDPPAGGPEGHQGRHGHRAGRRPVRGRAPGPGPDGPPGDCHGLRRREHAGRPPLLRDGVREGRADHDVLRPPAAHDRGTPESVHAGLRGRPACPPEGHHPPGPEALERARDDPGRPPGAEDHRLRRGEGHGAAPDRAHALHRAGRDDRHAGVHEPRAGRDGRPRHRHPDRRLRARRHPLRAADGRAAVRSARSSGRRGSPRFSGRSARRSRPARARASRSSARPPPRRRRTVTPSLAGWRASCAATSTG